MAMSDPLSSLKNIRRPPFRVQNEKLASSPTSPRTISLSPIDPNDDNLNNLADEVTNQMASQRIKETRKMLPPLLKDHDRSNTTSVVDNKRPSSSKGEDVSDFEMMSIMMSRITQLERRIHEKTMELTSKNRQIKILEEKVVLLQKSKTYEQDEKHKHLERKCSQLQQQVYDMENFLSDYGLIWVGHTDDDDDFENFQTAVTANSENEQPMERSLTNAGSLVWNPHASVPKLFEMNYDLVLNQIKELNYMAGKDEAKIEHTGASMARLTRPEPVPLTLFANGIVMFGGPFRSFGDTTTQQCLQDIMDGFFPSELETRYPDGVPFEVTDRREVFFKDPLEKIAFHGVGQRLGGSRNTSVLVDPPNVQHSFTDTTSEISDAKKVTMDQFLSHLPTSVVREGKVINIRDAVKDTIQGREGGAQQCTLVETASVRELQARVVSSRNRSQAGPDEKVATVRVRSEDGKNTYVVRMKFAETIGDLQSYIDGQRPKAMRDQYDIVANFPQRTLSDIHASIEASGLAPNATVYLRKRKG